MKVPTELGERTVYKSPRIEIRRTRLYFPHSKPVEWEYVHETDGVVAVPLLPDGQVILVREWRVAWKQPILQLPAGNCPDTSEKGRISKIHQELQEEIGMDAKLVKKLVSFAAFAGIHEASHIYMTTDLFPSTMQKGIEDQHEYVDIVTMPLDKALNLFLSGKEFTTSYTVVGLLLAQNKISII